VRLNDGYSQQSGTIAPRQFQPEGEPPPGWRSPSCRRGTRPTIGRREVDHEVADPVTGSGGVFEVVNKHGVRRCFDLGFLHPFLPAA